MDSVKKQPIRQVKENGVSISKWENKGIDGVKNYSYTIQKRYKAKEGEWKTSNTYFESDLVILKALIEQIFKNDSNNDD